MTSLQSLSLETWGISAKTDQSHEACVGEHRLHKTETVILTEKGVPMIVEMQISRDNTYKRDNENMGSWIRHQTDFLATDKVWEGWGHSAFSRLIANIGSPTCRKWKLLMSVTYSIFLNSSDLGWCTQVGEECWWCIPPLMFIPNCLRAGCAGAQ